MKSQEWTLIQPGLVSLEEEAGARMLLKAKTKNYLRAQREEGYLQGKERGPQEKPSLLIAVMDSLPPEL